MNLTANIDDKFYDFINMYNAIIKHCASKNRCYNINIYFAGNNLYFEISDKEKNIILHKDNVECNKDESKLLYNMITSEFILNHQLKLSAFRPMESEEIALFNCLSNCNKHISNDNRYYYFNEGKTDNKKMLIHTLENSVFTLNIYEFYGIDEQTEFLHQMALNKVNATNKKLSLKK